MLWHAMDKHEKKQFIDVKIFKIRRLGILFNHAWFLNHSMRWFLVVSPKSIFGHLNIVNHGHFEKRPLQIQIVNHGHFEKRPLQIQIVT
jgi:hypothetical protein